MDDPAAEGSAKRPPAIGIGIDFGTTYSTVVFIHSHKKRLLSVQYPGQQSRSYVEGSQVPSVVAADGASGALNAENAPGPPRSDWGFLPLAGRQTFQLFKLGLLHHDRLFNRFRNLDSIVKAQRIRNEHKVTAKEVTEVFLRELWTASLSQAADEFGLAVHQLQDTPFLVSMGVPANWSRDTVRDLREAADLAGIPGSHAQSDFSFLSEPEADLISFIEGHAISTDFTKGDIIGICDVGGGTIDTGAYECTTLTAPFMFQECVAGDSQLAGTVLLDNRFFNLLKSKVQALGPVQMGRDAFEQNLVKEFHRFWESDIKKGFNGTGERGVDVPDIFMTPMERGRRSQDVGHQPKVTFTQNELRAIFDPTIRDVVKSICDQVHAVFAARHRRPKVLVLCGGFSGNPYLVSRVNTCVMGLNKEKSLGVQDKTRLEHVSGSTDRMLAVARGCAYHALGLRGLHSTARICSRVSKDSYYLTCDRCHMHPVKFFNKGGNLTLDIPKRVRFDLATLGLDVGAGDDICLAVYRNLDDAPQPTISPGRKYCVIKFNPSGTAKVQAARESGVVHIGITYVWGEVQFHVYVGDELLPLGIDVVIERAAGNL